MIVRYADRTIDIPAWVPHPEQYREETEIRDAYWHPAPGEVVIDVGCGIGSYTIPSLLAGASVVAIDPHTEYLDQIKIICEANRLPTENLTLIGEAVADTTDGYDEQFWMYLAGAPFQSMYASRGTLFTTLDELAGRLGLERLDWVKVDVEGAELAVLRGGAEALARWHPRLLIEDHTLIYPFVEAMDSASLCRELLVSHGYDTEVVAYEPAGGLLRDYWVST